MDVPPWYVVTGGPSSGKSTLLEKLGELGYYIVPEAARVLIDENVARGLSVQELRKDEASFQQRVLQMKLEIEERTSRDRVVFFDRGIPDSIAYYRILGMDTTRIERISRNRYRGVFFLEQLPFQKDYARTEDETTIRRLNEFLLQTCENLGYNIIFVPSVSVKERLQLVLPYIR